MTKLKIGDEVTRNNDLERQIVTVVGISKEGYVSVRDRNNKPYYAWVEELTKVSKPRTAPYQGMSNQSNSGDM